MLLSPKEVQAIGLKIMNVRPGKKGQTRLMLEFHKHFGSTPLDIADMWYDLCYWDKKALSKKEKSQKGFRRFLVAMYWLWARPKNASMLASRFGICIDYCQGIGLWKWIERIANLMSKKIVWDKKIDGKETEVFGITTDGVDFAMWERQHPDFPVDTKACSHKMKQCAAKYIIGISVYRSNCVFIEGPFRGGLPDLEMYKQSGLMKRMKKAGKLTIADRGFRSKYASERAQFSYPDYMDSKELHNFKSRARLRQETFNRRLKHFNCLSETFKNGFVKHGIALRAVAVTVQYQMDNGTPLFSV